MNIRIYNARILTMEEGRSLFEGELHVKGNRIAYVGPALLETETAWDREIDAEGNVIFQVELTAEPNNQIVIRTNKEVYAGPIDFISFNENI